MSYCYKRLIVYCLIFFCHNKMHSFTWKQLLTLLHRPYQDPLPIRVVAACSPGHLQGALCQQECEGCSRVIFPPWKPHEESWLEVWLCYLCKVRLGWACNSYPSFYRDIYMPGLCLHGGYFEMLESGLKRREHRNMKFFWYEELKKDQQIMKEFRKFINCNLSE